jgi:hypothetical protein
MQYEPLPAWHSEWKVAAVQKQLDWAPALLHLNNELYKRNQAPVCNPLLTPTVFTNFQPKLTETKSKERLKVRWNYRSSTKNLKVEREELQVKEEVKEEEKPKPKKQSGTSCHQCKNKRDSTKRHLLGCSNTFPLRASIGVRVRFLIYIMFCLQICISRNVKRNIARIVWSSIVTLGNNN